jgi:hypothetical protein
MIKQNTPYAERKTLKFPRTTAVDDLVKGPDEPHDSDTMTGGVCAVNFGSMQQTNIQVTNVLRRIIGSNAEHNTMPLCVTRSRECSTSTETLRLLVWKAGHFPKGIR